MNKHNLTDRQRDALRHAHRHGHIKPSDAHGNTLKSLVARGLLTRQGDVYVLTELSTPAPPSPFSERPKPWQL